MRGSVTLLSVGVLLSVAACSGEAPAAGAERGALPPSPPGPHQGILITAGGRTMELVARSDGQVELYTLIAGPQAIEADWPISVELPSAGGAPQITSLHHHAELGGFVGTLPSGPALPGACRVGYIAGGRTEIGEGTLVQILPPSEPLVATAAPAEPMEAVAPAPAGVDAGAQPAEEAAPAEPLAEAPSEAAPAEPSAEAPNEAAPAEPSADAPSTQAAAPAAEPAPEARRPARQTARTHGFTSRRRRR
jgi:hypothetical protein